MQNITLIGRSENGYTWMVVENPTKEEIQNASPFLRNSFNEYLEYGNCGVIYRFVRNQDLHKYGIQEQTIDIEPHRLGMDNKQDNKEQKEKKPPSSPKPTNPRKCRLV